MMRVLSLFFISVLVVMGTARAGAAQDTVWARPAHMLGCYTVSLGPWSPALELGADSIVTIIPAAFELAADTAGITGARGLWHVESELGPSGRVAYWQPVPSERVRVVWASGSRGVALVMPADSALRLEGQAVTYWDTARDRQVAPAVIHRTECR